MSSTGALVLQYGSMMTCIDTAHLSRCWFVTIVDVKIGNEITEI